ncbi:Tigger transposable element-derived protein 2 [Eumeta japonica]|uniref:Tigger transposable element-derived protein 2 n=1 Tax=Eumeta variegata TaxID=151549 RepID=A0A4C1UUL0_EUMVA|nr:Tigger transposable element-derived protein 2 [Eumeta japonica]
MASKRKRVVLSLADKLKIIEQLDKGVTGKKLSEIYGVGQATISDIKNSKSTLLNFVSVLENEDGSSSRKTMKTATNKNLEDAVFKWFCSNVLWESDFRHGVRELDLAGEKLSADSAAAENFIEKFKTASESYDPSLFIMPMKLALFGKHYQNHFGF